MLEFGVVDCTHWGASWKNLRYVNVPHISVGSVTLILIAVSKFEQQVKMKLFHNQ